MSNILSQEEIDALLGGLSGGTVAPAVPSTGGDDFSTAIPFNFVNQDRIVRGGMPTLEVVNDRFARLMRSGLTQTLRRGADVHLIDQREQKFGEFMRTISHPSSMHVLRLEPLRGFGLLVLPGKLIYTMIDIFFGGSGENAEQLEDRDFTMIEQRIIANLTELSDRQMTEAWNPVYPLKISSGSSESNPQFINIAQSSDTVFSVEYEVLIGDIRCSLGLCIPLHAMDPIKDILKGTIISEDLGSEYAWSDLMAKQLNDSCVELRALLGSAVISINDLLNLKPDDIIQLREDYEHPVEVKVEGVTKFWGSVGSHKCARAVQVTAFEENGNKKEGI